MAEYQDPVLREANARAGVLDIDQGLRSYMLKVYNYMSLGVAFTAIVTLFTITNQAMLNFVLSAQIFLFFGLLAFGFVAPRVIFSGNRLAAQAGFWAYAALWGLLVAPMVALYMSIDPSLVFRAFLVTSATFAGMSLLGYTTKKDLSPFATFFAMAAIGLIVAMLVNFFIFQSTMMSLVISIFVVLLFSAITAWETQMVKELYFEGDGAAVMESKAIFGAFALYGSFMTLFIHILNIFGIMRD